MKFFSLIIIELICGLLWLASGVGAKVFTPESELFGSQLDGSWEFGEVVKAEFAGEEAADLLFSLIDQEVLLNTSAEPHFLVQNSFRKEFALDQNQDVWLELIYQPWSQETEAGFDDPVIVVFLNNQVILKKSIAQICCKLQTEKLYLGSLSGAQTLTIFAGEMGDLLNPSGVILQSIKIFGQSMIVDQSIVIQEIPDVIKNGDDVGEKLNQPIKEPDVVAFDEARLAGQVLGAEDENSATQLSYWQERLKQLVDQSWFVWLVWLVLAGVIWLMIRDKNQSRIIDNRLSLKKLSISSSKK
ncbi:MAG: hypothetical protein A2383_01980 [Candidatus Pacebacteria bacterium RIFOXYB1_FULL_39_46]|nr:MAG: hypothetical protein A2182_03495 [Candidatus Pacebacteria bacterium RIFOXYA1_FULL_38_18]OGJ37938.1 MAG: hypothetical protein A2383_01980 [Candidatus Pacebacteria bacterium RIFOXYB1_FULL_39_46]OGJ39536.1 MAG: hypothetical protein A2411_02135 [Candidatus Pacebacteria bacterium RIFOXYC1_FULL_39_21]OGJ40117.1 MAG: hypothetical protein A2582_03425 [Candidatus Pacebacteria bacterium RIFOXYD1_FULL_39_27]